MKEYPLYACNGYPMLYDEGMTSGPFTNLAIHRTVIDLITLTIRTIGELI